MQILTGQRRFAGTPDRALWGVERRLALFIVGVFAGLLADAARAGDDDQAPPAGGQGPRRLALLVGVNRNQTEPHLRYCCRDAELLRESLIRYGGFLPGHITMLIDEPADEFNRPSLATILDRLRQMLEGAREDDLVLVYFAGHGVQFVTPDAKHPCFLPQDGSSIFTGIKLADVRLWLDACAARQKVFIYDACRNDVQIAMRGGGSRSLARQVQEELTSPAFVTLFACSAGETAAEDAQAGHGVFTRSLAEGLAGAADSNGDKRVDVAEAFAFAHKGTTEWAQTKGMRQNPEKKSEGRPDSEIVLANVPVDGARPPESVPPHEPAVAANPDDSPPGVRQPAPPESPPRVPAAESAVDEGAVIRAVAEDNLRQLERLSAQRSGLGDVRTDDGRTLLHIAAFYGSAGVIDTLIRAGVDPEAMTARTRVTALQIACQRGHVDVVRRLLANHVRIDQPIASGDLPLHLTSDDPRATELITLLVGAGADTNQPNRTTDEPPLIVAARYANHAAVRTLLAYGADARASTARGRTALHVVVQSVVDGSVSEDQALGVIELLLDSLADAQSRDAEGATPLSLAQSRPLSRIVGRLAGVAAGNADPP